MRPSYFSAPIGFSRASTRAPGAKAATAPLNIPPALFEHRAVLYTEAHVAIAEVREVYQRDLLDFPEPHIEGASRPDP